MFKISFKLTSKRHSKEDLFRNIEEVWVFKGSQPTFNDMNAPPSAVHGGTYFNRFGSWKNALFEFSKHKNGEVLLIGAIKDKREKRISLNNSTKYDIMKRDNFKCCVCGKSPANELGVQLEIDHIVPISKGGNNIMSNLQTLCTVCNSGKSCK